MRNEGKINMDEQDGQNKITNYKLRIETSGALGAFAPENL